MNRKKDLKLNSIDRYLKSSPHIHLEEYSSCEVPAGCGGVVLRWVNQDSPIVLDLLVRLSNPANVWINGQPISNACRQYIKKGTSVLAFEFSEIAPNGGLIQIAGKDREENLAFISQPDDTWKYSTQKPQSDAWMQEGFDDSSWKPLIGRSLKAEKKDHDWIRDKLKETTAEELGVPQEHSGPVWIRKVFSYGTKADLLPVIDTTFSCIASRVVEACLDTLKYSEARGFDRRGKVLMKDTGKLRITYIRGNTYLKAGRHVVGIKIKAGIKRPAVIACVYDKEDNIITATQNNGQWKCTTHEPSADWIRPDYDDSAWTPMTKGMLPDVSGAGGMFRYVWDATSRQPAETITTSKPWLNVFGPKTVWIRHVFEANVER